MAEEIVNVGYLRDPETHEIFLPQTDESLVTGLTNKIDTAINNKINSLDGNATATDTGTGANVITEVSETDGILSSKQKTITEGSKIDVTGASGSITIAHESITTTPTDNSSTVGEKETYVITDVTTDGYGHVTAYTKDKSTNLIAADIKAPVRKTDNSMWNFRKTGGSISIGEDSARFTSLKGKTLVWNQLVNQGSPKSFTGADGSYIRDGAFGTFKLISGHKYYCSISGPSTPDLRGLISTDVYVYTTTHLGSKKWIDTANASGTAAIWTYEVSRTSYTDVVANVFDLTLMFGAGNEPSTVEEFEKLFPASYYSYNEGTLLSITADGIKSVGFNQWDEEAELGSLNIDGTLYPSTASMRTKNFISVFGDTTYCLTYKDTPFGSRVCFYDINHNIISSVQNDVQQFVTFTTPTNAAYIKVAFLSYAQTYPVYNHDICINLSDSSKNGTYEPYWKHTLPLNLNAIKVYSHNIWDEEWELGVYSLSTGEKQGNNSYIRCKNLIPVLPNTNYYKRAGSGAADFSLVFFDANRNRIGSSQPLVNTEFTTPVGCCYLAFYINPGSPATYNNDICINLSSSFNGQYEPYGDNGVITKTGGLPSAGSVYDEIIGNKYVKRVGSVDLGIKDYTYSSAYGFYSTLGGIDNIKPGASDSTVANITCSRYVTMSRNSLTTTNQGVALTSAAVCISSELTDASAFKTSVSGVYLNYELATPIEYELAEPIPNTYAVDDNGTEMLIPTGVNASGVPYSAPFVGTFEYSSNFKEAVLDLLQIKGGRAINIDANYEVSAKITDDLENDHPDDKLISAAQAFVELDERNVHADIVAAVTSGTIVVTENTITGTAAPSTAPTRLGQQYIKTSSPRKVYIAVGTSSSSDWLQVGSE